MKNIFILLLMVGCFSAVSAPNTGLPIESFAALKRVNNVKLSPNGENIAFITNVSGELYLMVNELETGKRVPVVKSNNHEVFLDWYSWANDDVLLIGARYIQYERGGLRYTKTSMLSYNIKTKEPVKAAFKAVELRNEKQPQFSDQVLSFFPEQKNKIIMQGDFKVPNTPGVYELDLTTLRKRKIQKAREDVIRWYVDRQGKVRIAKKMDGTTFSYELYNEEKDDWLPLFDYEVFSKQSVSILGFDKNPNLLYITALEEGRTALFKYDLTTKQRALVYSNPDYDFSGGIFYSQNTGEVAGFTDPHIEDGVMYWDNDLAKLHRSLRKALPKDDYDIDIVSTSNDQKQYVLYVSSHSSSGAYLLGNRTKGELTNFANVYPDIDETVYAGKKSISYTARDGLKIEGYLTLPVGYKKGDKLPTIIFPHGGPMARDYANFDYWTALLAYHGYGVLQPNFRGSSGYGYDFLMQSIKGFGLAMQDDLQDAANWLVAEGIADKDKICIGGASYGGYAAMMAIVKHPETFKCAASFGGVSDLEYIVNKARHFTNKKIVRKQFGTDSQALEARSPVNFAQQMNRPILLVHGSDDSVVPVYHSREMADELEDKNKDVIYIELEDGDHYLSYQPHRIKTLQAFLDFFDKHLKD